MRWQTTLPVRWSDVDGYGHLNNIALAGFVQEARSIFFREPAWGGELATAEGGAYIIVAHQEIEYIAQVSYRAEPLLAEVWVTRASGATLEIGAELWDVHRTERYLAASNIIALVPGGHGMPRRLTATDKAAAERYAGEPVKFRHHSYRGEARDRS